jgi:hypothetical protein
MGEITNTERLENRYRTIFPIQKREVKINVKILGE